MKDSISYILIFVLLAGASFGIVWYQIKYIEVPSVQFSITLSGEKGDFFVLFYRAQNESFSKEKMIKQRIVGDGVLRTFKYSLPEGTTNVRIDLSENQNQEHLTINNIEIIDGKGKSKIISHQQLKSLPFNSYCYNFEQSENGLRFNTQSFGDRYAPKIDHLNIPYLLYFSK